MKIWTDKQGNKLTYSEFMARWKDGITKITPLNQTKVQRNSTWIMIIGLVAGIITMAFVLNKYWWIEIILCGGLMNTIIQLIQINEKLRTLIKIDNMVKGGLNNGF